MPTQQQYDTVSQAFKRGKAALTRARNQKNWDKVIEVCDKALTLFEDQCLYPDDWAIFQSAKRDAEVAKRHAAVDACSYVPGRS